MTHLEALFWKLVEPLGSISLIEEMTHWERVLRFYSPIPLPSHHPLLLTVVTI